MTIATHQDETDTDPPATTPRRRGETAADPAVTGPMPAVVLASGHLSVHQHNEATVIAIDGGLDAELTDEIASAFLAVLDTAGCVVVDLERATLLSPNGVGSLLDLAADRARVSICLVTGRLSSKLVLERWGIGHRVAIFGSTADALQARAYSECGYGSGWTPNR